ncbi:lipoprotein [Actinokineospora sp. G85]|uniref:lipoprotein n=1 Tax=Actinokineospora sp. G85 TaxID=3406626 RepID=UPI003C75A8DE
MKARLAGVLFAGAALAGCGGQAQEASAPAPSPVADESDVWLDQVKPAEGSAEVDTPGTCPLPFTFTIAEGWSARSGDGESRDGLAAECAVTSPDGVLRVWVGSEPGSSPRGALERFIQGEGSISDPAYRESTVGEGSGVELTFAKAGEGARGRAFAVATPLRTLVVSVDAGSPDAYAKALPGYLLAKDSLTPLER